MSHRWNQLTIASALGALCSLVVWLGVTSAEEKRETSVLVNKTPPAAEAQAIPPLPPPNNPNERPVPSQDGKAVVAAPERTEANLPTPAQGPQLPLPPQSQVVPLQTQPPQQSTVKRPFMRPAQPLDPAKGRLVVGEETMPIPPGATIVEPRQVGPPIAGDEVRVLPTPKIEYDTDHDARKMYRTGRVDLLIVTTDPTDGCAYQIPLSIPACCVGDPRVSSKASVLGRGVVEYRWACGFRAIVKFRHVLGDVRVDYEGD